MDGFCPFHFRLSWTQWLLLLRIEDEWLKMKREEAGMRNNGGIFTLPYVQTGPQPRHRV
ncbi:hypothetical protein CIAM_06890 [Citrobacter amalonaticus]|nr:hypothetical protein CIAM_06890 [Citrobacter amalonaticus]GJK86778.1 hypothetical protein TUM17567_30730 [Citrobacter amalonaticus]